MEAEETNSQPHASPRIGEGFIFSSRDAEREDEPKGQSEEQKRERDEDRRGDFNDSPTDSTGDDDTIKSWEDTDRPWGR